MKRNPFIFLVLFPFFCLLSNLAPAQSPLTLEAAYALALKQSERVALKGEDIRNMEAKYRGAVGKILPAIHFKGTEFLQDDSAANGSSSGVGSTLTRFSKPELRFNAKQPIFQGFREFHALAAARAQKKGSEAEWEQAKRLLFMDVVKAFYAVIQAEQEKKILEESQETLQGRLRELQKRVALGKSRQSDLINTESELAIQQATLNELEGALTNAKEVLAFFTGSLPDKLQDEILPQLVATQENPVSHINQRPDITAARETLTSSQSLLKAQKGERFPNINVEANYYPYRVGFQSDIRWDALFSLDFPLFQGGQLRAKIQEAKIAQKKSQIALEEKKRQASLEIKQAYNDFVFLQKQAQALEKAVAKSSENVLAVEEDYRLGLTNNLEVLDVLLKSDTVKRDFYRTLAQSKIGYFNWKVVSGETIP